MKLDPKLNALAVRLHGRQIGIVNRLAGDRHLFSFEQEYVDDPGRPTLSLSFKGQSGGLVTAVRPVGRRVPPFFSNLLPEGHLRTYLAEQAGVKPESIVIWDRLSEDLDGAGFRRSGRIRCQGNEVLGYESELSVFGSAGSLLAKTLTQLCDVVINLPVLKDHGIVGVTMALKNMFGAIHNPNKYHPNGGDPYVADVNMLPPIRAKVRLHICDAIAPQYEGGPSDMPQWSWACNSLLVAQDPVALDSVGWQIIEQKRAEKGLKPLKDVKREPRYIATAADAKHNLGTNDPSRIERVEV